MLPKLANGLDFVDIGPVLANPSVDEIKRIRPIRTSNRGSFE